MTNRFFLLIGQALISVMFILVSFSAMMNYQSSLGELEAVVSNFIGRQDFSSDFILSSNQLSQVVLVCNIALQFLGGVLVFFNLSPRLGAILLMIYIAYSSFLYHPFWLADADEVSIQLVLFLKNLTIFAGLWILLFAKKRVIRSRRKRRKRSFE